MCCQSILPLIRMSVFDCQLQCQHKHRTLPKISIWYLKKPKLRFTKCVYNSYLNLLSSNRECAAYYFNEHTLHTRIIVQIFAFLSWTNQNNKKRSLAIHAVFEGRDIGENIPTMTHARQHFIFIFFSFFNHKKVKVNKLLTVNAHQYVR